MHSKKVSARQLNKTQDIDGGEAELAIESRQVKRRTTPPHEETKKLDTRNSRLQVSSNSATEGVELSKESVPAEPMTKTIFERESHDEKKMASEVHSAFTGININQTTKTKSDGGNSKPRNMLKNEAPLI